MTRARRSGGSSRDQVYSAAWAPTPPSTTASPDGGSARRPLASTTMLTGGTGGSQLRQLGHGVRGLVGAPAGGPREQHGERGPGDDPALDPDRSEERRVGKSVAVRVELGGRRIIKKKT